MHRAPCAELLCTVDIGDGDDRVVQAPRFSDTILTSGGLVVRSLPDAFSNWAVILCPAPCDGTYFAAHSRFGVGTYYAAYYDSTLPTLRSILRYEFDSQIPYRLGYNVNWR